MSNATSQTIHLALPDGRQLQLPEEQLQSLRYQGIDLNSAMYWKEGMSDWRPLADHFTSGAGTGVMPPPLPAGERRSYYTFAKDPSTLTGFLKVMLWVGIGTGMLSILSDFAQLSLLHEPFTQEAAEANDARQGLVGLIQLGTYLITAVTFLMWIYRANTNARGFGALNMEYTPGWSVGYFFIPFVNLVRPYRAMKEIWMVSSNPRSWTTQPGSPLLTSWWTLWLLTCFLGQISFRLTMHADTPSSLETATIASILAGVVDIPLSLVAIAMVSAIYRKQKDLVEKGF